MFFSGKGNFVIVLLMPFAALGFVAMHFLSVEMADHAMRILFALTGLATWLIGRRLNKAHRLFLKAKNDHQEPVTWWQKVFDVESLKSKKYHPESPACHSLMFIKFEFWCVPYLIFIIAAFLFA
jgi:hypothetical protein